MPGVYERVIDEINLLGPDLVVDVGDHIEGYGEDFDPDPRGVGLAPAGSGPPQGPPAHDAGQPRHLE